MVPESAPRMSYRGGGSKFGRTIGILSVHSRVSLAPDTTAIDRDIGYSKSLGFRPDLMKLHYSYRSKKGV